MKPREPQPVAPGGLQESAPATPLRRELGTLDATAVALGAMVGAGIFVTPAEVAASAPSAGAVLGAWGAGGAVALLGAVTFAVLGRCIPRAGGTYAFLEAGLGRAPAFLFGWGSLLVINTGAMAFMALTAARYLLSVVGADPSGRTAPACALAAIWILTAVNLRGVKSGAWLQDALTAVKVAALAALSFLGLFFAGGGSGGGTPSVSGVTAGGFFLALLPVLFSYGGWQNACNLAEEVKSSERSVPRAVLLGVTVTVVLYLLFNWALIENLGPDGLARSKAAGHELAARIFGANAAFWISALIVLSVLGVLNGLILGTPRILYAMARDGLFFPAFARLTPRAAVPARALLFQGAVASLYVLFAGLRQILDGIVAVDWIFFGLAGAALVRLRGGPRRCERLAGALFAVVSFGILVFAVTASLAAPKGSPQSRTAPMALLDLAILGLGLLAYAGFRRGKGKGLRGA